MTADLRKAGVDTEKFITYIHSKVVDEGMYYLLFDEIQMPDCFEAVLNGYLRKDYMDVFVIGRAKNKELISFDSDISSLFLFRVIFIQFFFCLHSLQSSFDVITISKLFRPLFCEIIRIIIIFYIIWI